MAKTIKPEKVGGFLDYLPPVMIARKKMLETIEKVYQKFGFVPLDTPAIERLDVLTGNDKSFRMNLYRALIVSGLEDLGEAAKNRNDDLALRFDLTVPLSRVVAAYPEIIKPFKRYQVGKVWRGEKAQAGRFREFVQFDADIIGSRSMLADTEIIQIMYEVMIALGVSSFLIRFNNRKIFEALNEVINLSDAQKRDELIRIIDKRDKVEKEEIEKELKRKPDNKWDPAPNLSTENVKKVIDFISITGSVDDIIEEANLVVGNVPIGQQGICELKEIVNNLRMVGMPSINWCLDLSVARGLGYYTGPVFETVLTDLPEIGSVYSGGRFDGLTDRFIPGSNIPGTGASVGVDRLFAAMEKLGKIKPVSSLTKVLIAMFDHSLLLDYLTIANELRREGIETELYLNKDSFRDQITYAAKKEIPLVVIIGSKEKEQGKVSLRDMRLRSQETIDKSCLISKIRDSFE